MSYILFIPHLFKEIDIQRIQTELGYHRLGEISKIDIVKSHHNTNNFFIHYSTWNNHNPIAIDIKNKLDDGHACNLYIISSNTYWKILKNTSKIHTIESSWKLINNPFETKPSKPSKPSILIENKATPSSLDNLSLFDRMIGSTSIKSEEHNTTTSNNIRIDDLENRIKKLEAFVYYHTN